MRDIVGMAISNELHPLVRKRLTEIAQLLQVYARLAELELAAGGRPRFSEPGEYGLPGDIAVKAKEWAEKARIMEGIAVFNKDPMGTLEAMR